MSFVYPINVNSGDSHQVSPSYVITFLRWSNRDTKNYKDPDGMEIRKPLVIYNDAIQVSVTCDKSQFSSTATMVFKGGDINYATAVYPGDYVLINMVNSEVEAQEIRNRINGNDVKPINGFKDGFKGVFKIQSVVKSLTVNRDNGRKTLNYIVTAASFTEFNNVFNFNPDIAGAYAKVGANLYQNQIGNTFAAYVKENPTVQHILPVLFKSLIGKSRKTHDLKGDDYGNPHYQVPGMLGRLLGIKDAKYMCDINNYIIGVWQNTGLAEPKYLNPQKGFNLGFKSGIKTNDENLGPNFFTTGVDLEGSKVVTLEDWNNNTAWSILQGYLNSVINEMYTCYRVDPKTGKIMPTIIARQKPFTSDHFYAKENIRPVTKYSSIPRWKVSADLLYDLQLSKNDSFRYNFVQVFTQGLAGTKDAPAMQIALKNFVLDERDIIRNGQRPYIVQANFNFLGVKNPGVKAVPWSRIVSDWMIDGHLKEAGIFTFQGLTDPICVGDNLEFDNVVYHIESVAHNMVMNGDRKTFTTRLTVSFGMDKRSSADGPVYANMEHTDAQKTNQQDWNNQRILPGISDTQNISGRDQGEEVKKTEEKSFTPNKSKNKGKPKK